jgi:hypothetical protein
MKELIDQDIFDQIETADAIAIATNCSVDANGINPMSGGMAAAAAYRWSSIPAIYGFLLHILPNVPLIIGWVDGDGDFWEPNPNLSPRFDEDTAIVAYPTMRSIMEPASLPLVKRSAELLVELADLHGWTSVCMGRNGCGIGGLDWETQVKPLYTELFDDRFTVMHKEFSKPLKTFKSTETW